MRIIPGYDFTQFAVPTKATLQQMLSGASVTAIDITQINTALIGSVLGDTSASMPLEGWLRTDNLNCIWVKDQNGAQIRVDRASWGGWETRRLLLGAKADTFPYDSPARTYSLAARVEPLWITVNDTGPTNIVFEGSVGANTLMMNLKCLETALSGFPTRVLGRGGCIILVNTGGRFSHPDYMNANQTLGSTAYSMVRFPYTAIAPNGGVALQALPSFLGGGNGALAWSFGAYLAAQ